MWKINLNSNDYKVNEVIDRYGVIQGYNSIYEVINYKCEKCDSLEFETVINDYIECRGCLSKFLVTELEVWNEEKHDIPSLRGPRGPRGMLGYTWHVGETVNINHSETRIESIGNGDGTTTIRFISTDYLGNERVTLMGYDEDYNLTTWI